MDIHQDLELKNELEKLNEKFLEHWFPVDPIEHTPKKFEYDVKSYCILSHAAFEEYIEKISLEIALQAKAAWLNKIISKSTLCLMTTYLDKTLPVETNENNQQDKIFDLIRNTLNEAVIQHGKAIFNNHGFSLKYLRTILTPVGLDVPTDPKLTNSLNELAKARGSFAHTRASLAMIPKTSKPMSPEDAREIVKDCFELCIEIKKNADIELKTMQSKNFNQLTKINRSKIKEIKNKNFR